MNTQFEYKGRKVEILRGRRGSFIIAIDGRVEDGAKNKRHATTLAMQLIDSEEASKP